MKPGIAVLLILLLTVVMIYGVIYLGEHDSVDKVIDVNTLKLGKGRTVSMIGIAPTGTYQRKAVDEVEGAKVPKGVDSIDVIVDIDTSSVEKLREYVEGRKVELKFCSEFEPDSASVEIAAYVYTPDETELNAWVLEQGLAKVHPEHRHPKAEQYLALEAEARAKGIGIWGRRSVAKDSLREDAEAELHGDSRHIQ